MFKKKQQLINGLAISYYLWNAKRRQPLNTVVLLHGWRSEAAVWFNAARQLVEQGYQVLALDLPGFGESQNPPANFALNDYAAVLAKLLENLELPRVALVGHSFGARVALKTAVQRPELVERLVLVASGGWRPKQRLGWQLLAKIVKPVFSLPVLRSARRKIYQLLGAEDYLARPELRQVFLNILKEDTLELAASVSQPTLVIWGEKDSTVPVSFGQQLQQKIKDAQLEVLPTAGHFVFLDKPGEFLQSLITFLHAA